MFFCVSFPVYEEPGSNFGKAVANRAGLGKLAGIGNVGYIYAE